MFGELCQEFPPVIIRLRKVSSTMDIAKEFAVKGAPEWTVVIAEEQTSGRGRLGRRWISPRGGLWFSLILHSKTGIHEKLYILPAIAGVSVATTVKDLYGLQAKLKWPNDIILHEKKLGGILIESLAVGENITHILGIGLNVNIDSTRTGLSDLGAVSIRDVLGREVDISILLKGILNSLLRYFFIDKKSLLEMYRGLCETIGKRVKIILENSVVEGTAIDVSHDFSLIVVDDDGQRQRILWGDVIHLR